ncbi:unnamed protein product [Adineta steineri]|uniref:Uncharacterized protein n=2 Tax=Adineta steineri TaxID=433720 RepID=A0A819C6D4_9BILA|nr:unnamed protein product [Adineta steineri]CAF0810076.1 unnamed protein product [Adineta steineri]CAF0819939.1 unnamed protein product [Adineta steineri]CAF3814149.1 unnamed protein product [Adineta steineri]
MSHSADDPDDLVRKKIDLNHITNMSYQMHVPDSITVGPTRSTHPRLDQDYDRVPIRMEVPDRLRPGGNGSMVMLNDTDFFTNGESNHLSDSIVQQPSLPSILHPKDIDTTSDDDYTSVDVRKERQPVPLVDSWHMESLNTTIDDKHVSNKLQLLQNRVHQIERKLVQRETRDRIFYTCIIGYFLVQALRSVRRSMLN